MSLVFRWSSTRKVQLAFDLMCYMHRDQKYGDLPYKHHVLDVVKHLPEDATEDETIMALLHDTIEDTDLSCFAIADIFGQKISDAVMDMTHANLTSYNDYIGDIIYVGDRSTIRVKLADNHANRNGDKSHMTPERRDQLNTKYDKSIERLTAALAEIENA